MPVEFEGYTLDRGSRIVLYAEDFNYGGSLPFAEATAEVQPAVLPGGPSGLYHWSASAGVPLWNQSNGLHEGTTRVRAYDADLGLDLVTFAPYEGCVTDPLNDGVAAAQAFHQCRSPSSPWITIHQDADPAVPYEFHECPQIQCPPGTQLEVFQVGHSYEYVPRDSYSNYTIMRMQPGTNYFDWYTCVRDVKPTNCCYEFTCEYYVDAFNWGQVSGHGYTADAAQYHLDNCSIDDTLFPSLPTPADRNHDCAQDWTCTCSTPSPSCKKPFKPTCP